MDEWQQVLAARKVLNLPETATFTQVKSAYRRMAKQFHPDQGANNGKDYQADRYFKQVTLAYQILERFWEHLPVPLHPEKLKLFLACPSSKKTSWFQSMLGRF